MQAPDERYMHSHSEMDVAHFKQRLVRANVVNSELTARMAAEAKAAATQIQVRLVRVVPFGVFPQQNRI